MLRILVILVVVFLALAAIRGVLIALRGRRARSRKADARAAKAAQEEIRARRLLGLGPKATAAEVKAAYRTRAARAHPDAGGSAAKMAELTAARDLLLSKEDPTSGK